MPPEHPATAGIAKWVVGWGGFGEGWGMSGAGIRADQTHDGEDGADTSGSSSSHITYPLPSLVMPPWDDSKLHQPQWSR